MRGRWLALAVLTVARATLGFQFQSVGSIAPLLVRDLGLSYVEIGVLIGLYTLPGVVLALPGGLLGQRFGDKRVVLVGLLLMVAGGVLAGLAQDYAQLVAGRVLSGTGAILLNVLMSKMVTDWFAGREIVLAMAVFVNSFPIGIGIALLGLGRLGETAGWGAPMLMTGLVALAGLLLVLFAYRPHANDRRLAAPNVATPQLPYGVAMMVCIAGIIWGFFNGAFGIVLGFAPLSLISAGESVSRAGLLVGVVTWLLVLSIQVGGILAQRWKRPNMLMFVGMMVAGVATLALPTTAPLVPLTALGLGMGLPVGVIMSLPSEVLRPEHRGTGMGLFYTWLYIAQAALPPIAGRLQDIVGGTAASIYFASGLFLATLLLFGLFRLMQARVTRLLPAQAGDGSRVR
jgi:MFS family permease